MQKLIPSLPYPTPGLTGWCPYGPVSMAKLESKELLEVTLNVWHPDCWGIISTDQVGSGLLGHGASLDGTSGFERCTIHGDSPDHVQQAIDVAKESQFIKTIEQLPGGPATPAPRAGIGQTAQDVFIEYDATEGMGSAFLSEGFVLDGTYRIDDGMETWELLVYASRESFRRTLDTIQQDRDADVSLTRISPATTPPQPPPTPRPQDDLTARQREALQVARQQGYYEWPREVSATELATDLGVSKATFLEHLRKAEATLLGPDR